MSSRNFSFIFLVATIISCDSSRVYERNNSFENKYWVVDSIQNFEVHIDDKSITYNIYMNVRNSSSYPYNNIYVKYSLADSSHTIYEQELINNNLFDTKTGKPLGQSGIGDLFDHQFLLLEDFSFQHSGKYIIQLKHYMRPDTLVGILATGVRVEKNNPGN